MVILFFVGIPHTSSQTALDMAGAKKRKYKQRRNYHMVVSHLLRCPISYVSQDKQVVVETNETPLSKPFWETNENVPYHIPFLFSHWREARPRWIPLLALLLISFYKRSSNRTLLFHLLHRMKYAQYHWSYEATAFVINYSSALIHIFTWKTHVHRKTLSIYCLAKTHEKNNDLFIGKSFQGTRWALLFGQTPLVSSCKALI